MFHRKIAAAVAAPLTPTEWLGLRRKDAPGIDVQLREHIDLVTKALDNLKDGKKSAEDRLSEFGQRLFDMEQRSTRPGGGGFVSKGYGAQVAESEQLKSLQGNRYHGMARIELKAITTGSGSAGGMIYPDRDTDIVRQSKRAFFVRSLLTVLPTTSGSIDWAKQTTRTNSAAPVAETNTKPYSAYGWTKQNTPVRTIAHLAKLSRQAMDDAAQLAAEVDTEMRYGLQLQEDTQILYGDGTGENLYGLMPQATAYSLPTGLTLPSSPTRLDLLGAALLQQSLTDYAPDGIVLHPTDWMSIRLLKDAAGAYLFGDPGADVEPRLFGLPVATTQGIAVGNFLLGGFKLQRLYDRLQPEVLISSENADDFEKNLLTMRCEERVALTIRIAAALIKGTFS